MAKHGEVGLASMRAGMDRATGRKYLRMGKLPSELRRPRTWRTRPDPFAEDWPEIEARLTEAPELDGLALFEDLMDRHPGRYQEGQIRTFQRRVDSLADYRGRRVVLNIIPSLDSPVCAASLRKFNGLAGSTLNTTVLWVSGDLPFAAQRFCAAEGLNNLVPASCFRNPLFGESYGVAMVDGPMRGLMARAVVVVDEKGAVLHTELVPDLGHEPNYDAVEAVLK